MLVVEVGSWDKKVIGARSKQSSQLLEISLELRNGKIIPIVGATLLTVTAPDPFIDWDAIRHQWNH